MPFGQDTEMISYYSYDNELTDWMIQDWWVEILLF
jgi:hypothetical protein